MTDPKVKKYSEELKKLGIEHEILEHPQLLTVIAVQKYLGFGLPDAAATLVMKAGDNFVAIIKRGDTKLNNEKVKKYLQVSNLRMANEAEFAKLTGVPSGAAPVYIPNLPTYVDRKIFDKEFINAGSGSLLYTFRYKTEDLKKIPEIKTVDFAIYDDSEDAKGHPAGKKRIFSGINPSGDGTLHIGNYLGAVKQFVELAKTHECFLGVVDIHALTTVQDKDRLLKNTETLILNELALLGDLTNIHFFRQSDVPMHTELQSIINNVTPLGLIKRAHAYKDKLQKQTSEDDINMGLFCYPVLMAADILLYKGEVVPVGKDQKQHIEIARDIAEKFNKTFKKDIFPLPEAYIPSEVAVIMGTDGKRKMSKSLGNIISIFESEETIKKQVMSTYTDPTRVHPTDQGHIEGNMVFAYLDFFGEESRVNELKNLYKAGKIADIEVKNYLFESLMKTFKDSRERYRELKTNPQMVKKVLSGGAQKAREVAGNTMREVRDAVGLTNKYSLFRY